MQINNTYMNQGIINIGWVTYKYFLLHNNNIFIFNITRIVVNQNTLKPLFHLIRSSTKIVEFDHVKYPPSI